MIYLATDGARYRVGFSGSIPERLAQLSRETGSKITLLCALDVPKEDLSSLQGDIASLEIIGGWYMLDADLLKFFKDHPRRTNRVSHRPKIIVNMKLHPFVVSYFEASAKFNNRSVNKEIESVLTAIATDRANA